MLHPAGAVERDPGPPPIALALLPQRHRPRTDVDPFASLAVVPAVLRLDDVGEVRCVREVEPDLAGLVAEVLEDDVLVHTFGDEAVAADGERRRVSILLRADDVCRV